MIIFIKEWNVVKCVWNGVKKSNLELKKRKIELENEIEGANEKLKIFR